MNTNKKKVGKIKEKMHIDFVTIAFRGEVREGPRRGGAPPIEGVTDTGPMVLYYE